MKCTEQTFLDRVKDHQMQILRDDGLYRHIRFGRKDSSVNSFSLITWPGYLCYCGDMGDYLFQRIDDMFEFFRGRSEEKLEINPSYWSEKVEASCDDGTVEYSPEMANEILEEIIVEGDLTPETEFAFRDEIIPYTTEGEYALRRAVEEFSYDGWYISDFWEYNLNEYTFRFLFCCYAIVWGIRQYDKREVVNA